MFVGITANNIIGPLSAKYIIYMCIVWELQILNTTAAEAIEIFSQDKYPFILFSLYNDCFLRHQAINSYDLDQILPECVGLNNRDVYKT